MDDEIEEKYVDSYRDKYYKSKYDNSIIKVIGGNQYSFEVIIISSGSWSVDINDQLSIDTDRFVNEDEDNEYIELKCYNTPLFKALNDH